MAAAGEHLTPIFQQNEVLFGHDSTPGLIAFEIEGIDKVGIFRRQEGQTGFETIPFRPFMLLEGDSALKDWKGEAALKKLGGEEPLIISPYFPT